MEAEPLQVRDDSGREPTGESLNKDKMHYP